MNHTYTFRLQRLLALPLLIIFFLTTSLLFSPRLSAFADESTASNGSAEANESFNSDEEAAGVQAFWDFFGPDGVDECLQPEFDSNQNAPNNASPDAPSLFSNEQAILTTSWATVGGGRVNRKYLNGLIAFCYDEELAFPNGASYGYATASDAAIHGQIAAIAQRFGQSGIDNAQWWSECQVAIWAVRAGCRSYDSAAAFARSYCADRKITDPATVEDYAYIVGTLVAETLNSSATAYLYQASDPANQRILTYLSVWPDPAPIFPSPRYDVVSAQEEFTAFRHHSISIDPKSAAITGEPLAGAVFEVYENDLLVGTITTDTQGQGNCQWTISSTAASSATKEYCSNYDKLDPETRKTITGYTNREDALAAAREDALADALAQAEILADTPYTVTIRETAVPTGFTSTTDSLQPVILTGNDSTSLSVINIPWSATLLIDKVDGTTGEPISADATFFLYEWDGSDYVISPHYEIIRREDGMYTASSDYPDGEIGRLYYTQANQGRFALTEATAPEGYLLDPQWFFFEITENDQTILAHNAFPEDYPICDSTKFANTAVTGTIQITKTGDYLTNISLEPLDNTSNSDTYSDPNSDLIYSTPHRYTEFHYTCLPVSGASFSIYTEDSTLIATITTDDCGLARLEGLPLGTYIIREVQAGAGDFLLDPAEVTVTLSYQDQFTAIVLDDSTHFHNQRQTVYLEIMKQSQTSPSESASAPIPLAGAVYGLYAADDIYGYLWDVDSHTMLPTEEPLLSAHTLLEHIITDAEGLAFFRSDLPCGQYYIRELRAPEGYLLNDTIYPVDASYTGQDGDPVLHLFYTFENAPIPPAPTEEPAPPSSPGAPTGDNKPLLSSCLCLLSSLFLMIRAGLALFFKKSI